MDTSEVAAMLNMSTSWVYREASKLGLKGYKLGRGRKLDPIQEGPRSSSGWISRRSIRSPTLSYERHRLLAIQEPAAGQHLLRHWLPARCDWLGVSMGGCSSGASGTCAWATGTSYRERSRRLLAVAPVQDVPGTGLNLCLHGAKGGTAFVIPGARRAPAQHRLVPQCGFVIYPGGSSPERRR